MIITASQMGWTVMGIVAFMVIASLYIVATAKVRDFDAPDTLLGEMREPGGISAPTEFTPQEIEFLKEYARIRGKTFNPGIMNRYQIDLYKELYKLEDDICNERLGRGYWFCQNTPTQVLQKRNLEIQRELGLL